MKWLAVLAVAGCGGMARPDGNRDARAHALKRLFIVEHSATPGTKDKLHSRPLDD